MPKRPKDENGNELPTNREKAFVQIWSTTPGISKKEAALKAGYAESCAYNEGYKNTKKNEITKPLIAEKEEEFNEDLRVESLFNAKKALEMYLELHFACKSKLKNEFDSAAVNAARACLDSASKIVGLFTDKIQLNADISTRHSVEMVKIIETDTASAEALDVILERRRKMIEAGSA